MKQLSLMVYRIDMKYIRNLHSIDDRVLSVSPQVGKDERPFLGVIVICNEHKYCVPLSKPKKKHEKMRDKIDFKKNSDNGKLIGVLNFNLMIPVEEEQIQRIDTKIRKHDNADTRRKKELLIKELQWCNAHIADIVNTANDGILDKALENAKKIIFQLVNTELVEELGYTIVFEVTQ